MKIVSLILFSLVLSQAHAENYVLVKMPESKMAECGVNPKSALNIFESAPYLQVNGALLKYKRLVETIKTDDSCSLANKICAIEKEADELLSEIAEADSIIDFVGQD